MPGIISEGMRIERLFLYPIKSIRGIELDSTTVTKYGFANDRCFMVLKPSKEEDDTTTYKNTAIAADNEMCRFFPAFDSSTDRNSFTVTFKPVDGSSEKTISIPLEPETEDLQLVDVLMHKSPTQAFLMPDDINKWFTACFGYDVVLAYIGNNTRDCRMSSNGYKAHEPSTATSTATSWLSSAASVITGNSAGDDSSVLKFTDVAPYLITSSKSMDDVYARLPENEKDTFDITKFRPNLIVSGAEKAWEEDYWAELSITSPSSGTADPVKIECEHNCGRCRSINIDYATGAQGTGEAGKMLKKLSSDRRVDKGTKWSPIFGRYSFLHPKSEGREISVGDRVKVTRRNGEHTAFDWKGLSTLPDGGRD